jgi:hypothetical protein
MSTNLIKRKNPPNKDTMIRMLSDNYSFFDNMFRVFEKHPTAQGLIDWINDFEKINKAAFLKETKKQPLGAEFIRRLFSSDDALSFVITSHLFIETFINEIIRKKFSKSFLILNKREFSFSLKLDLLKSKNYFDDNLYLDLQLINTLRNKFAHNLNYDIAIFDASKFTYCDRSYEFLTPNSKVVKRKVNLFILRLVLYNLLLKLTDKYPFIGKITIPDDDDPG